MSQMKRKRKKLHHLKYIVIMLNVSTFPLHFNDAPFISPDFWEELLLISSASDEIHLKTV